jgi:alcohol dehydrogenase class IV
MMPYGLEFNRDVSHDKYKYLEKVIEKSDFIGWVRTVNSHLGIPSSLKAMNLDAGKISQLSDLAIDDACHQCNPKAVTRADFESLFKKAFLL